MTPIDFLWVIITASIIPRRAHEADNMACSENIREEKKLMISNITEENALEEFKAGVVRSMKQYNAGLVKTFADIDDFLDDCITPR